jgi:hypothetical protein
MEPIVLTLAQLTILGVIASVLTQVFLVVLVYVPRLFKKPPIVFSDRAKQISLGIVSIVVGYLWAGAAVPPFPPMVGDFLPLVTAVLLWSGELLAVAVAIMGWAHVIYKALLKLVVFPATRVLRL